MTFQKLFVFLSVVSLFLSDSAFAQLGGGRIVRVDEEAQSRCIDPYKDKLWLTLRSLVISKNSQFLTKDKEVSIIIKAKVQTDPVPQVPIVYPLMASAKIGEGPAGQYSIPIEYSIVSGLVLKQDSVVYSGIGADITLVNVKDRSGWGTALQTLDSITSGSKLPIPSSPYTQAASYLISFANSAVQKDIDAQNSDNKAVAGSMQFNFDPNGQCAGDFEQTGTKALIYAQGDTTSGGYVPLNEIEKRCFSAQFLPSFVLKSAPRPVSGDCRTVQAGQFQSVANNYLAFYLNKQTITKTLGANNLATRDMKESLMRCKANGVSDKKCLQ
ncbi:hypothetical protein VVD49_18505 [Uliginosibacterium sp. H3]|uniref:Uncharacterized protein n=1 Tax=Uliginosibacterium silvisoli TaxID=3114758 RepID=A0ABU6K8G9_9RHOO|nr:hypothetical protein [Uliginosibacterium sp. H3]